MSDKLENKEAFLQERLENPLHGRNDPPKGKGHQR